MKRVKLTNNFFLDEWVDPVTYAARGAKSIQLLDMRIVMGIQYLREQSNRSITLNNWAKGGQYKESGLRALDSKIGAKWSQHKFGRAGDCKVDDWTPTQFLQFIMEHEQYLIENQFITTIENVSSTPTWLHVDCRYTGSDKIIFVNP